jgi:hypothetical protein
VRPRRLSSLEFFSQEQRVFIVEHCFDSRLCTYSKRISGQISDITVPNNAKTMRLFIRFRESGSIADRHRSCKPNILTPAKLAEVQNVILQSPSMSLRRLSATTNLSYGNATKALKTLKYRAYHIRCVQELKTPDKDK